MVVKNIFLLRHAEYVRGTNPDPDLSKNGIEQACKLARKIMQLVDEDVEIWTSTAQRACQTAEIIGRAITSPVIIKEKLWSQGVDKPPDFIWLHNEIDKFKMENLIIVSHLEYVHDFPPMLDFFKHSVEYAEGVVMNMEEKTCRKIFWSW